MRRVLVTLLAAALMLSACGGAQSPTAPGEADTSSTQAPEQTAVPDSEEKSERPTAPSGTDAGTTQAPEQAAVSDSEKENRTPTGYGDGELQIQLLYCYGKLWIHTVESDNDPNALHAVHSLNNSYTLVGQVQKEDSRNVPETELAATHIAPGVSIYVSAKDDPKGEHIYYHEEGWEWYYPMRLFQEEDKEWIES